jgi:NAD-dependent SIR2 family protein deacetylase
MKTPVDIASLARYILSPDCQSIALLTGAGVSVASGIPDFRSPGGMYDTLRPDLITCSTHERLLLERDPTYVVSWEIFQANSFPTWKLDARSYSEHNGDNGRPPLRIALRNCYTSRPKTS